MRSPRLFSSIVRFIFQFIFKSIKLIFHITIFLMKITFRTIGLILKWFFFRFAPKLIELLMMDYHHFVYRNLHRQGIHPVGRVPPYPHIRLKQPLFPRIGEANARQVGLRPLGPGRGRCTRGRAPRSGDRPERSEGGSERKRGP